MLMEHTRSLQTGIQDNLIEMTKNVRKQAGGGTLMLILELGMTRTAIMRLQFIHVDSKERSALNQSNQQKKIKFSSQIL